MKIELHLTSGEIMKFEQTDAEKSKRILPRFSPREVYSNNQIFLADESSSTAIHRDSISYIKVTELPEEVDWKNHLAKTESSSISAEEYASQVGNREEQRTDGSFNSFLRVSLESAETLFLHSTGEAPPVAALGPRIFEHAMDGKCLVSRYGDSGYLLLNTENISYLQLATGMEKIPINWIEATMSDG